MINHSERVNIWEKIQTLPETKLAILANFVDRLLAEAPTNESDVIISTTAESQVECVDGLWVVKTTTDIPDQVWLNLVTSDRLSQRK